ncbi:autophagy-related protein 11 [Marchantia polymorpha subsp. ruderalis]|uniref:Ubiquitin-like domain-containing protein n=2 Tax=Marchantia polymorpha TaxID=3197 RepID=A0AAF6BB48_MARPO|nr:hypothetical protein MARPO_0041s0089 [Marchantia polymorpha]BBN09232.1 hypothetical protein Mp_4g18080 [Marchantia polymorpha subsp. ruderalis]|eukprot:PTQ40220.1 hypothetical protein MARPO_0041s0089 [Marchantia polymorpha]
MEREMKIEIHVAENGKSYELECQASTTIQDLQSILPQISGIPAQDQMLITSQDNRLEAKHTLQHYGLPSHNKSVFLFNRCRLVLNSPYPPEEEFEVFHVEYPPLPTSGGNHPLDESSDPVLKALPNYYKLFKYHHAVAQAFSTASNMRLDACRRLLREQEMQEKAMETARGNMDHFYRIIKQNYSEFLRNYNRLSKYHSELLENFERDLERLRNCRLHPGLCSTQLKTLLDCVNESRVRKWAEECSTSFSQFNLKVSALKENYTRLDNKVQVLFNTKATVDVKQLAGTIEDHAGCIEEQNRIIQSLGLEVNQVKKLMDDCVSSQYAGSARPHKAVSALRSSYDIQKKRYLPTMESTDNQLQSLLEHCEERKTAMTRSVHSRLQSVASLQSSLKEMRNQLAAYKEAMNRQATIFSHLRLVRRMGSAYKGCLAEVVRRKAWMKLFMGQAGQLAERMARKREAEVARREEFLKEQSHYFNREVLELLGLYENPSQCVVNIPPFDTQLLELDIVDVERYAPEALVGPLLKISGTDGRGGSTRSLSDSAFHTGIESQGGKEDHEGEVDDDGDNDEINGTSKLEVENAWLKAELASAVARLCHLDPEFEPEEARDVDDVGSNKDSGHQTRSAVQSMVDALRLKDDYAKHLRGLLNMRQSQCKVYEDRIRDLEQRLQDQHLRMQKFPSGLTTPDRRDHGDDSENSGLTALRCPGVPEPMDEGASSLAAYEGQQLNQSDSGGREAGNENVQTDRMREVPDEAMSDVSGVVSGLVDAAMEDGPRRSDVESTIDRSSSGVVEVVNVNSRLIEDSTGESGSGDAASSQPADAGNGELGAHIRDDHVLALENMLVQKTQECEAVEERLRVALAKSDRLLSDLDSNAELLNECQVNISHLENRLHDAREEARINLCAADRRATEYNALRSSSVRLRGLTERLKNCISTSGGVGFADALRALAVSLSSPSASDAGEDDFRNAIKTLAEKVGVLAQQRAELLERCKIAENNQNHMTKTLDELKKKRQMEKQASKEMICFTRFQVHGLAVFIQNGNGHYEALNRNCPHYYLSEDSIALFLENLPSGQHYIVGQIVHIDRSIVRSASGSPGESEISGSNVGGGSRCNPYGLPVGTEFFVVTVAMVPDFSPLSLTM